MMTPRARHIFPGLVGLSMVSNGGPEGAAVLGTNDLTHYSDSTSTKAPKPRIMNL